MVRDTKAEDFCRNISNFSLEYRNARQAIILQREREQQRAVAGIPAPGTPVGRRKCQQEPSQVPNAFKFRSLAKIGGSGGDFSKASVP